MKNRIKNKWQKLTAAGMMFTYFLNTTIIQINAASAGDNMKNIINQAGEQTQQLGNLIGAAIASCISVICGISALFIVGKGAYSSWKNHGVENVFEQSGTQIGTLAIVAVIAGIVAAVFFNA